MQAYRQAFAHIYNLRWGSFPRSVAPRILEVYQSTSFGREHKTLLDLCCGAGHLALFFLEKGFQVTGIDLSAAMLNHARQNTVAYVEIGKAEYLEADAAHFEVEKQFGLVVSTFDALNHLPAMEALQSCFRSVFDALLKGGIFVFDLNTRQGLQKWNSVSVEDSEDLMLIKRGVFDGQNDRAICTISGFVRTPQGYYERFEETVFNTAFEMEAVRMALLEAGFREIYTACSGDLCTPIEEPEMEDRAFFVARK